MPRLSISTLDEPRRDVLLAGDVTIGRAADNVLVLADDSVSTAHARIRVERRRTWIEDLGSTNGTLVGGQRIAARERVTLATGDHVAIGHYILEYVEDAAVPSHSDDAVLPAPRNTRSLRVRVEAVLRVAALVAVLVALAAVVLRRVL
jgi:pSer/pThr/pTyr-binding forkhead associated (FHA) protein